MCVDPAGCGGEVRPLLCEEGAKDGVERGRHLVRRQELANGSPRAHPLSGWLRQADGPRHVRRGGRVRAVTVQPFEPADDVGRAEEEVARVRRPVQPRPQLTWLGLGLGLGFGFGFGFGLRVRVRIRVRVGVQPRRQLTVECEVPTAWRPT